jgi:hypothetical protein
LVYTIWRDRRKPTLDLAQAQQTIASSAQVKATIQRMSDETNAARDLRIWDLEQYADKMRPWVRLVVERFDQVRDLMRWEFESNGRVVPFIEDIPPPPELPPPRPLS